jgi:hypothetical protein
MEGVLAQGTRLSLTRRRLTLGLALAVTEMERYPGGRASAPRVNAIRRGGDRGRQRRVSQACRAVENTAGGRYSAGEPSIEAPPGPRWPHTWTLGVSASRGAGRRPSGAHGGCGRAEAGGSPSSEAPPGAPAGASSGIDRARRVLGHGSRLQKSVRRIFPVAKAATEPETARRRGSAGWLEATHPPLTGQDRARGEREGAGRGDAREQRAMPSPPGPQGPGRSDGRCSGPSGGRRPNPTASTAGLARWKRVGRAAG